jgi:hypothetical protein
MVSNKYNQVLLKLIGEWFENRKTLFDYDFVMLSNLATTTINGNYGNKKTSDLNKNSEVEQSD